MGNWLEQVHKGKRQLPRRILLYGVRGIGKSTWASMSDRPIFIPTEDGIADIDCASFPLCDSFPKFMEYLGELYTNQHDFGTVVIDSADWLERLIWNDVAQARGVDSIASIDFQKGYEFAITQWRETLCGLDALRNERGMYVILLAHAKIEKFANPLTETYDRYQPRLHKYACDIVQEWCDEVLFATYKVYTKSTNEGFNKTRNQGIGSGERVIYTTERPACAAKNRLSLPDELKLDWNEYAKFLNQGAIAA